MDLGYWGFTHWPFQRRSQTDSTVTGASHEEAFARLLFIIDERRRCGAIVGSPGIGKSCLFRGAAEYARRQGRICLEIDASGMDATDLLLQLAEQMNVDYRGEQSSLLWPRLQQQFANCRLVKQAIVVLADNLDSADSSCGQMIRRLIGLADALDAPLTVLVSSRSPITSEAMQEQIEMTVELTGWSNSETAEFVASALIRARAPQAIFTPDALSLIHKLALGTPAEVIRICDLTLLAAMGDDLREVDASVVNAAMAEFSPRPTMNAMPRSAGLQVKASSMF